MNGAGVILPCRVYPRRGLGVDPPSIALGLDLANHMLEGVLVVFEDVEADPVRSFELHRLGDAFRITDGTAPPHGTFASAQAAIAAGWAMVDRAASLPPFSSLVDDGDPNGGFR